MTKTTKIQLISKNDDILDYRTVNKLLWQLQKETRAVANRCVQMCWEYSGFESEWKQKNGSYPTSEESKAVLGGNLSTHIYGRIKELAPSMNTGNLSMVNQSVCGKFKSMKKDILRGDVSIPSYKNNMPIELHKRNIKLEVEKDDKGCVKEWLFRLSLLSTAARKENNLQTGALLFKAILPAKSAKSVRTILERCCDEVYSISGSKLKYENGKWFLMLCYSFDKPIKEPKSEQMNNIMGVHIGEHNAISCTFNNSNRQYNIDGGEVLAFSLQVERRRRNIGMASSKSSVLCGGGRVGHGYKTKMQPLEHISNKIANFRNTTNHRYSRQIVNWAVANHCGVIQIEDLNGLSDVLKNNVLLKDWSYYDLISKIEYKAKEYGIKVVKVGYKNLWKWCADCNALSVERKEEKGTEYAVCTQCGQIHECNYNIQKALIIADIDEQLKSKKEESKDEE